MIGRICLTYYNRQIENIGSHDFKLNELNYFTVTNLHE